MPSVLHDTLVDLFRHCASLALMLAGDRIPGATGRAPVVGTGPGLPCHRAGNRLTISGR